MLVLSRKAGQRLKTDGNIIIEMVKIQGNRISLGIVAPSNVKIVRDELTQPKAITKISEQVFNEVRCSYSTEKEAVM